MIVRTYVFFKPSIRAGRNEVYANEKEWGQMESEFSDCPTFLSNCFVLEVGEYTRFKGSYVSRVR